MLDLKLIEENVNSLLISNGYDLVEISYHKEGSDYFLSIEVDRKQSISMDDIVDISNKISSLLDKIDTSDESYMLDIYSSGVEKEIPLEELNDYIDNYIHLELIDEVKGLKEIEGTLVEVTDTTIKVKFFIKGAPKKYEINLDNIKSIKKAIKF